MCCETQKQIFVCTAEDTINGRLLTLSEKYVLKSKQGKHNGQIKELAGQGARLLILFLIQMNVLMMESH